MHRCPCDPERRYADCCGPLHAGAAAGTAEALMRSRYSAYVLGDRDYLLASWHPRTRPAALELDPPGTLRWLGLAVRRCEQTGATDATVEFVARCKAGGAPATRLCETSRFRREDGRWYYLDGEFDHR